MTRRSIAALLALVVVPSAAYSQDGPLRRAGRNIRAKVENEVAREQITAQERDVLRRVAQRIEWDKQFVGSSVQIVAMPGGAVALKGSVISQSAKLRAVDLVENTIGVTRVVDELAVVKDVKVIQAKPAGVVVVEPVPVVVPKPVVVPVPADTVIIEKR